MIIHLSDEEIVAALRTHVENRINDSITFDLDNCYLTAYDDEGEVVEIHSIEFTAEEV